MDVPEQDSDAPVVSVAMGMPAQVWVEAAARSLDVRTQVMEGPRPTAPADGDHLVVHAVRSPYGQVVTYALARETWLDGDVVEVMVDSARPDADLQRAVVDHVTAAGIVGAASVRTGKDVALSVGVGACTSAAWTIDGCVTSLFENHVRALLDLPLGSPRLWAPAVVSVGVGAAPQMHAALRHCFARDPELRVHLYGKDAAAGMTIGHVTVVADDVADAARRARHAAAYLTGTIGE